MITKIINGKLVLNGRVEDNKKLYFEGDKITGITAENLPCDIEIDACGKYVSPGFIDTHIHGGVGFSCTDGGIEPILKIAEFHLKHGTTTILPSPAACSHETMMNFLADLRNIIDNNLSQSRIPGTHLEGSYFSHGQLGAQKGSFSRDPVVSEYTEVIDNYKDIIKRWSFAPELPGSVEFCKAVIDAGITPSIGHTNAVYEDVIKVYDLGCRMVTHLYSSMSTITREKGLRRLGVIESAYLLDDIIPEVISDGAHLPPELLKLIIKHFGYDRICMITDATRCAGIEDVEAFKRTYKGELDLIVEDDVAKLPDRSSLAGSIATTDRLVRTMVKKVGVSIPDAIKMMCYNPAKSIGEDKIGELKVGNFADIVIFDENINISNVIVGGKSIDLE